MRFLFRQTPPVPRRARFRPALEGLEMRITPGLFDDLWQFNEGETVFNEIAAPAPTPPPRQGHAATEVDGKLVIQGGVDANGVVLSDMWEFDPATNTWTELTQNGAAPGSRLNHTLVALNDNELALFGGSTNTLLFVYNRSTSTWSTPNPAPFPDGPLFGHKPFVLNGNPFVFGGKDTAGAKSNDLFFKSGSSWFPATTQGTPPAPRHDAADEMAQVDGDGDTEMED